MDSDSMRNFLFSQSGGDFNSYNNGGNDHQAGGSSSYMAANNGGGGQMMGQNDEGYPMLLRQYLSQQQNQQQQQDFSSQQQQYGQLFESSSMGSMQGQILSNNGMNFSGYGNMGGMQQNASFGNIVPQAIAATPTSSQSDLSHSDRMFGMNAGLTGLSNASFMCNVSSPQGLNNNNSFLNQNNTNPSNSVPLANLQDPYAAQGILGPWSERSAGLLGKMVCSDPSNTQGGKVKRARRKQPKDKPKRPLSAYNIFFKEERQRLLNKAPNEPVTAAESTAKRTANGKIGFESLAKIIGGKWQDLKPTEVEYYKEKAAADMQRYKSAMEEYNKKIAGKPNIDEEDEEAIIAEGSEGSGSSKRQRFE